jgi:RNA-directed DNA polymerase
MLIEDGHSKQPKSCCLKTRLSEETSGQLIPMPLRCISQNALRALKLTLYKTGWSAHHNNFTRKLQMASKRQSAEHLTTILLSGEWTIDAIEERARDALRLCVLEEDLEPKEDLEPQEYFEPKEVEPDRFPWLNSLIIRILTRFNTTKHPKFWELANFIINSDEFTNAWMDQEIRYDLNMLTDKLDGEEHRAEWCKDLVLPLLNATQDVAEWLNLTYGELEWFADIPGRQLRIPEGPLHHYVYQWHDKKNKASKRLVESPKARLKKIQRKILREILAKVPVHNAAHGFQPGRSCLSFVAPHCGQEIVLRMDLKNFFPSITSARIHGLFQALGFSLEVTRLLAGLCTHTTGNIFWSLPPSKKPSWFEIKMYQQPHLPQGAPTSPALANICTFRLDRRLVGLAEKLGLQYTRYADDLAFSGKLKSFSQCNRMHVLVASIAIEEGFTLNTRKTKTMRQGASQRLTGLVVNQHPNIKRLDYDRLKAILYNCKKHRPETQNHANHDDFKAHLAGRVSWVETVNPRRGRKLRMLFEEIEW